MFWAVFVYSFSLLINSQLESDVCRLPYTWSLNSLMISFRKLSIKLWCNWRKLVVERCLYVGTPLLIALRGSFFLNVLFFPVDHGNIRSCLYQIYPQGKFVNRHVWATSVENVICLTNKLYFAVCLFSCMLKMTPTCD